MTVYFIGAGPGAADLITVRGARILAASRVCLYAGSLVPVELLAECPEGARLVDTADLDIEQITAELVRAHAEGHDVARLHSGDPSVFSAVNEQMKRLDEAGIPYEVVPGVPAFGGGRGAYGAARAGGVEPSPEAAVRSVHPVRQLRAAAAHR
ncbi:Siroheme synthase [Streptomyces californicus]